MRGDSVRDFYAKALALFGLAVLAGTGALVDYWPIQNALPSVSFQFAIPARPSALDVKHALASPIIVAEAVPSGSLTSIAAASAQSAAAVVDLPTAVVPDEESVAAPAGEVETAAPAPLSSALLVSDADPGLVIGSQLGLPDLPASVLVEPLVSAKAANASTATPNGNVFQKAGGQILNAGLAVGTGVAKTMSGFGKALSNIGKLFTNK